MKRIMMLCCAVLLLFQTTAFTKGRGMSNLPPEEMCIGGIARGCPMGYVKTILGEPQEIISEDDKYDKLAHNIIYKYPNGLIVWGVLGRRRETRSEDETPVWGVTLKNSDYTTPSGFTVGMPYKVVDELYGGVSPQPNKDGQQVYAYINIMDSMRFYVNNEGIITMISFDHQQ